jgi:hypothetical protein
MATLPILPPFSASLFCVFFLASTALEEGRREGEGGAEEEEEEDEDEDDDEAGKEAAR